MIPKTMLPIEDNEIVFILVNITLSNVMNFTCLVSCIQQYSSVPSCEEDLTLCWRFWIMPFSYCGTISVLAPRFSIQNYDWEDVKCWTGSFAKFAYENIKRCCRHNSYPIIVYFTFIVWFADEDLLW